MGRTVVGFAWYAYRGPDPAAPGRVAPPTMGHPRGVLDAWPLRDADYGIGNFRTGPTYLVITGAPSPPRLAPGWAAEPAELDEGLFRTEGGRLLLVRLLSTRRTRLGAVQECEFEVRDPEAARGQGGPR